MDNHISIDEISKVNDLLEEVAKLIVNKSQVFALVEYFNEKDELTDYIPLILWAANDEYYNGNISTNQLIRINDIVCELRNILDFNAYCFEVGMIKPKKRYKNG